MNNYRIPYNLTKKVFLIFASLLLTVMLFAADGESGAKKRIKFIFKSETKIEVGIGDYDNAAAYKIQLAKNQPEIEQDFSFFWRIKSKKNKRLYIGPYFNLGVGSRFDYPKFKTAEPESTGPQQLSLERLYGGAEAGAKIIYRLKKKKLKGSSISVSLPVHAEIGLRYDNPFALAIITSSDLSSSSFGSVNNVNLHKYHTSLFVGIRPEFNFTLNIKKIHLKFGERLRVPVLFDVMNLQFAFSDYRMLLGVDNRVKLSFAPFNFINKKVDVWLTAQADTELNWIANELEFENEIWFEIKWTGFKYLHIGWKPIVHELEFDIPLVDQKVWGENRGEFLAPGMLYNHEQSISMDIWIKARVKFFEFVLGYRPCLYAIDRADINLDEHKPHIIYSSIVFKI